MDAKLIIQQTLDSSDTILKRYIEDLDQADMLVRPAPGMNCIAWQLGHLISSEGNLLEFAKPGTAAALPEGFEANHNKEAANREDTSKYLSKDEYLALYAKQRKATKDVLEGMSEADLNGTPGNTFGGMCPTNAHMLNFIGAHYLMHVGQFVPIRRKSGKPVVI